MERLNVGWATFRLSTVALVSFVGFSGCGNVSDLTAPSGAGRSNAGQSSEAGNSGQDEAGRGGRPGVVGGAGGSGHTGFPSAGASSNGGSSNGGSSNGGSSKGGSSNGGGAGECESAPADAPCFEPCGGDPVGSWVLEDACLSGRSSDGACQRKLTGKALDSRVRLQFLDGGSGQIYGVEDWDVSTTLSLSCLGLKSAIDCNQTQYLSEALLFANSSRVACTANACGSCDCDAQLNQKISTQTLNWTRDGNLLALGASISTAAYCVQGDELWFGGTTGSGKPKVAYKFKKMSCTGEPIPCAARTQDQCAMGTSGSENGLVQSCVVGGGTNGCSAPNNGQPPPVCTFASCDTEPGCSWGPAKPKCVGHTTACDNFPLADCASYVGCSVVTCLDCSTAPTCRGKYDPCGALSLDTCHDGPGCRVEW